VCDDGNNKSGDGCSSDCLSNESCGNGIVDWEAGEQCDPPDALECNAECILAYCGNGIVDQGEICDDGCAAGNKWLCEPVVDDGDGCSWNCLSNESCGNGICDTIAGEDFEECPADCFCMPSCIGKQCGEDGCGGECGFCPDLPQWGCTDSKCICTPQCDDKECGEDGCGGSCGTCTGLLGCAEGACVEMPLCGDGLVEPGEKCDDGNDIPWDGCSSECTIVEFQANDCSVDEQFSPAVGALVGGGYVLGWSGAELGSDLVGAVDVWGMVVQPGSGKSGPNFVMNTYLPGWQGECSLAGVSDGGFIATWHGGDGQNNGWEVLAQFFTADGSKSGEEFHVNQTTKNNQKNPTVARLDNDNLVVVWQSNDKDPDSIRLLGQLLGHDGALIGSEFQVNTTEWQAICCYPEPELTSLSSGGFVVVWRNVDFDQNLSQVMAQAFDKDGDKIGEETVIDSGGLGWIRKSPAVAKRSDDTIVVLWHKKSSPDGEQTLRYGMWVVGDGLIPEETGVLYSDDLYGYSCSIDYSPAVGLLLDDSFIVAWNDFGNDQLGAVHLKKFSPPDQLDGEIFKADSYPKMAAEFDGAEPELAVLANGDFVVVWKSCPCEPFSWCVDPWTFPAQDGDGCGIFAQRFDKDGNKLYH